MKNCKNLLIGFFYPDAKIYFKYYFQSINNQSTNDFELLIVMDNIKFKIPKLKINYHIININKKKTISSIRNLAISFAQKNNYEKIIFSDTDDYFSHNRIFQSIRYLNKYDFVVNNLYKVDKNNNLLKKNLYFENKNNFNIAKINLILRYNFIGFTNSALNVELLRDFKFPQNIIALDWYIFSFLLLNNKKGFYLKNVISYYRSHNNNYINDQISIKQIKRIILIKSLHFKSILKTMNNKRNLVIFRAYSLFLSELKTLNRDLINKGYKINFLKILKNKSILIKKGWWSNI